MRSLARSGVEDVFPTCLNLHPVVQLARDLLIHYFQACMQVVRETVTGIPS